MNQQLLEGFRKVDFSRVKSVKKIRKQFNFTDNDFKDIWDYTCASKVPGEVARQAKEIAQRKFDKWLEMRS